MPHRNRSRKTQLFYTLVNNYLCDIFRIFLNSCEISIKFCNASYQEKDNLLFFFSYLKKILYIKRAWFVLQCLKLGVRTRNRNIKFVNLYLNHATSSIYFVHLFYKWSSVGTYLRILFIFYYKSIILLKGCINSEFFVHFLDTINFPLTHILQCSFYSLFILLNISVRIEWSS